MFGKSGGKRKIVVTRLDRSLTRESKEGLGVRILITSSNTLGRRQIEVKSTYRLFCHPPPPTLSSCQPEAGVDIGLEEDPKDMRRLGQRFIVPGDEGFTTIRHKWTKNMSEVTFKIVIIDTIVQ